MNTKTPYVEAYIEIHPWPRGVTDWWTVHICGMHIGSIDSSFIFRRNSNYRLFWDKPEVGTSIQKFIVVQQIAKRLRS